MTITEAAKQLGLKPSTLRHQRKNGKLRATRMGRDWFVSDEEVARYRSEHLGKNQRASDG